MTVCKARANLYAMCVCGSVQEIGNQKLTDELFVQLQLEEKDRQTDRQTDRDRQTEGERDERRYYVQRSMLITDSFDRPFKLF